MRGNWDILKLEDIVLVNFRTNTLFYKRYDCRVFQYGSSFASSPVPSS
jgi:hypothetical protein